MSGAPRAAVNEERGRTRVERIKGRGTVRMYAPGEKEGDSRAIDRFMDVLVFSCDWGPSPPRAREKEEDGEEFSGADVLFKGMVADLDKSWRMFAGCSCWGPSVSSFSLKGGGGGEG